MAYNPKSKENLVHTMWEKGQSGNPRGKPKGAKNLTTQLKEMLNIKIKVVDEFTGKEKKKSLAEIISQKLIKKAMNGDIKAIKEIIDRLEGKPAQSIDVNASVDSTIYNINVDPMFLPEESNEDPEDEDVE